MPQTRCCLAPLPTRNYILCATCPHRPVPPMVDYDDYWQELVEKKDPSPVSHKITNEYDGPLWQ